MGKEKCDCGKLAVWCYMPGFSGGENSFSCNECVSRGCSCNDNFVSIKGTPDLSEDGVEGQNWEWRVEGISWYYIDEKGREYPCCEYDYDESGFE